MVLFEPEAKVLISADALWENGFGVVFPELEGVSAFDEVAATLNLIETLNPLVVIPGHGKVFLHVAESLRLARRRLDSFVRDPRKHANHAAKVLLKFKLLELQRIRYADLSQWAGGTRYFEMVRDRYFPEVAQQAWLAQLTQDLVRVGAAARDGDFVLNV